MRKTRTFEGNNIMRIADILGPMSFLHTCKMQHFTPSPSYIMKAIWETNNLINHILLCMHKEAKCRLNRYKINFTHITAACRHAWIFVQFKNPWTNWFAQSPVGRFLEPHIMQQALHQSTASVDFQVIPVDFLLYSFLGTSIAANCNPICE